MRPSEREKVLSRGGIRDIKEAQKIFFQEFSGRANCRLEVSALRYETAPGTFPYLRLVTKLPDGNRGRIILRGSIHGNETPGTNTLLLYGQEIIGQARKLGLETDIHFCGNPYGFPLERYNPQYSRDLSNGKKYEGNNDFLRYRLADGRLAGDLGQGSDFKSWYWSFDRRLKGVDLPRETILAQEILHKEYPTRKHWERVKGLVDLHSDPITPGNLDLSAAYHYGFGDLSIYRPIVEKIKRLVPVWEGKAVDVNFGPVIPIDRDGFVVRHDGSLPDLAYRQGVRHAITTETTGGTALATACEVNLYWIFGVMELAAKGE